MEDASLPIPLGLVMPTPSLSLSAATFGLLMLTIDTLHGDLMVEAREGGDIHPSLHGKGWE